MIRGRSYPRRGLHGELVHDIGVRILRGDLRPGDSLPLDELAADDQGVSRTVVREVVKVLAAKGLIESRPKTGTIVRDRRSWNLIDPDVLAWRLEADPSDAFFLDVVELRLLIEPAAAGLAAARATADETRELRETFSVMEQGVGVGEDAWIAADVRFHSIILESCHNELLGQLGANLRGVFQASFTRTVSFSAPSIPMHGAICMAIDAHDAEGAEAAMRALIERTAERLKRSRRANADGRPR
jgi:GntR family galactonate operon transcriptional repressor